MSTRGICHVVYARTRVDERDAISDFALAAVRDAVRIARACKAAHARLALKFAMFARASSGMTLAKTASADV